jgi:transposase
MDRLIERCAMLDVHKSQITACVRVPKGHGGRRQEIREFQTTTSGLLVLADWLCSFAVTVVGMESTGVYWRAVFYLLEDEFDCRLYNARHLRHVPGRKSDVQDAEWGCQLVEHGSFARASCRRGRCASCVTWSAIARPRSRSAAARSSAWRRRCRTPGSSCPRSPLRCSAYPRGGRSTR